MSEQPDNTKIRWHALLTEEDLTRSEVGKGKPAYKLSKGRVMGWTLFAVLIWMWVSGIPVPQSLVAVFLSICAYNLGKKSSFFQDAINQKTGAEESKE